VAPNPVRNRLVIPVFDISGMGIPEQIEMIKDRINELQAVLNGARFTCEMSQTLFDERFGTVNNFFVDVTVEDSFTRQTFK